MDNNPYSYPYDGRNASDSPGLWTELISCLPNEVPWENFMIELNSPLDCAISKHVIKYPWSPFTPILNCLFGYRGRYENINI